MSEPSSHYEQRAREEIEAWKNRSPGKVAGLVGKALKPVDAAIGKVVDIAIVGKAIDGAIQAAMDAGTWTVQTEEILSSYRSAGYDVSALSDIARVVPLAEIDKRVAALGRKYRNVAAAEGATAGATATFGSPLVGAGALVGDVAFLTTWSCRATAEYAAYYGFDPELHAERAIALQVLNVAGSYDKQAKQAALVELTRISGLVAKKTTWQELQKSAVVRSAQELAKSLGVRLTKAKLAQLLMFVGAFLAGGYNAWYLGRVCDAAYFTYRNRYLDASHPADQLPDQVDEAEIVPVDVTGDRVD